MLIIIFLTPKALIKLIHSIDLFQLIKNGNAHSEVVVGLFLFATAVLTYLQFNWGYRLVLLMYKQLSGSGGGSSKKEDKKK